MSDNLDIAQERSEMHLADALRARKPEGPAPTGRCLWCDEIVSDEQRWCDSQCRDMWERDTGR